jgi:heat shock protein HtpX
LTHASATSSFPQMSAGSLADRARPPGPFRRRIRANYVRTALLLGVLTTLVVLVADALGGTAWAAGALLFMAVFNLASWYFSDTLVIALHRARPLTPAEAPQVHAAVERLSRRAGIPVPRVYYVPDPAPNAFATGRNPRHAAVAVTDGLFGILDDREIEAVLGHELAHVLNRDILISSVAATMAGAISLLARAAGWALLLGQGRSSEDDRPNPLSSLLLVIVAPLIALMLQLAVSRSQRTSGETETTRLSGHARLRSDAVQRPSWPCRDPADPPLRPARRLPCA